MEAIYQDNNSRSLFEAMSMSKKTGKNLKINNLDCEEYVFESDSESAVYYPTPVLKDVPFSTAALVTFTKHHF
ncbi:MAG: hypothetical protein U5M51_04395 [Emticicia sp.]|nr:hypothetical protein [Emticicia sp.]